MSQPFPAHLLLQCHLLSLREPQLPVETQVSVSFSFVLSFFFLHFIYFLKRLNIVKLYIISPIKTTQDAKNISFIVLSFLNSRLGKDLTRLLYIVAHDRIYSIQLPNSYSHLAWYSQFCVHSVGLRLSLTFVIGCPTGHSTPRHPHSQRLPIPPPVWIELH